MGDDSPHFSMPYPVEEFLTAFSQPVFVIDYYQGLTDAIVEINEQYLLLMLFNWDEPEMRIRYFSVSPVAHSVVEVFLRNMRSDYCDLARKQQEADALITASDEMSYIVSIDIKNRTLGSIQKPPKTLSKRSWREGPQSVQQTTPV